METSLIEKKITVLGLGRFGGGEGAARWLASRGAQVTVTDLKSEKELREPLERLNGVSLRYVLGRHDEADLKGADLVVINPALPADNPWRGKLRQWGVPVTTEMNLFLERVPCPVIAVTGSAGKSTTTTLLSGLLEAAGVRVWTGGNIGRSLLSDLERMKPSDRVALEISSFQLADLSEKALPFHGAVFLNLFSNHIDWHGSVEAYAAAKLRIFEKQGPDDFRVVNMDERGHMRSFNKMGEAQFLKERFDPTRSQSKLIGIGTSPSTPERIEISGERLLVRTGEWECEISLRNRLSPGKPFLYNAASAVAAALHGGGFEDCPEDAPWGAWEKILREFPGLPHRLEKVADRDGILWYNDSKATTPESALAALTSFDRPVVLIAGGRTKGGEYGPFVKEAAKRTRASLWIGETGAGLAEAVRQAGGEEAYAVEAMDRAVSRAAELAQKGDVVLLSPACASYDQYSNYEERGDHFRKLVKEK